MLVVDALRVLVGSTKFFNRSFRLNDEANLNLLDAAFAQQQTTIFEADLALSKPISLQAWRERPLNEKMTEYAASLLRAQL